jgi:hypothetical protein
MGNIGGLLLLVSLLIWWGRKSCEVQKSEKQSQNIGVTIHYCLVVIVSLICRQV